MGAALRSLDRPHIAARLLVARAARAGRRLAYAPCRQLVAAARPGATATSRLLRRAEQGLRSEGFAVVPGFAERARCEALLRAAEAGQGEACPRAFSEDPALLGLAKGYLGISEPIARCGLRRAAPGAEREVENQWRQGSSAELFALVYLEPIGQSQGPLEVLPGSHKLPRALRGILGSQAKAAGPLGEARAMRWPDEAVESLVRRRYGARGVVSLAAPAGSLVVYDGAVLLRSGRVSRGRRSLLEIRFSNG